MGKQEYILEATDALNRWYILGSYETSPTAQQYMRDYRRMFPKLPLRVREYPSRQLIVLNDPTLEAFAS